MSKIVFPYVGVTGFMTRDEVEGHLSLFPLPGLTQYVFMVGVLASSKTLAGKPNKWPGRYPQVEKISDIILPSRWALNLVHYNTDEPRTLLKQLVELQERAGPALDGFQLNIAWPPIPDLEDWYDNFGSEKSLVLQIGGRAMEEVQNDPEKIAERIGHYLPMIDYVLIDPSGGKGEPFDSRTALAILKAIDEKGYSLGLGIAGGFGPKSLTHLKSIAKTFPNISIDAEGKLRTPKPEDKLDSNVSTRYITEARRILKGLH